MEEEAEDVAVGQTPWAKAPHIKKRALKNKALAITFNDKDLRDFVTGFHKRKKKRRKEANQKVQEKARLKRIEGRKKRKLEKELALFGGERPAAVSGPDESGDDLDQEECQPTASISGTKMYDDDDLTIMVTTTEISQEEDKSSRETAQVLPKSGSPSEKRHNIPVTKKKTFKKAGKHRTVRKPQKKRDIKKGKKKNRTKKH